MNKGLKIILVAMLIILAGGMGTYYFYNRSQTPKTDPFKQPQQVYSQDAEPKLVLNNESEVTIYVPNANMTGYDKKEVSYKGDGTDIQQQILNDVLFTSIKKSGKVSLPDGVKVLDMKVWDETLQINFSKDILNTKINDPITEKYVIGSIVNSMLTSSQKFTDVQFLVEGKRVDKLFGHFNTKNPLMYVN